MSVIWDEKWRKESHKNANQDVKCIYRSCDRSFFRSLWSTIELNFSNSICKHWNGKIEMGISKAINHFISLSLILLQKPSSKLLFGPLGCGSNYNFDSRFMFVCCFFPLYLSFVSSFVICLCIIAIISCVSMCFFALLLFFFKLISAVVSVNVQVKFSRFVFVRSEIELGKWLFSRN